MASVSFKLEGVQEAINKLKNTGDAIAKEVDREIADGTERMAKLAKQKAPVDMGKLQQSISARPVKFLTYELVAQAEYAPYVEFGTKSKFNNSISDEAKAVAALFKGAKSKMSSDKFDEFEASMVKWVKRKQIRFESKKLIKSGKNKGKNKQLTYNETAKAIMFHILKYGIKPQPYFFPAYYEYKKKMIDKITTILNEKRK